MDLLRWARRRDAHRRKTPFSKLRTSVRELRALSETWGNLPLRSVKSGSSCWRGPTGVFAGLLVSDGSDCVLMLRAKR